MPLVILSDLFIFLGYYNSITSFPCIIYLLFLPIIFTEIVSKILD